MLIYCHGVVQSGKTAMLIEEYEKNENKRRLTLKSDISYRFNPKIESRNGSSISCQPFSVCRKMDFSDFDFIFVDEAQFLDEKDVFFLKEISDRENIIVFCSGITSNHKLERFDGSKALFQLSNIDIHVKKLCTCGRSAVVNWRVYKKRNEQSDNYMPICYVCYSKKKFK